MTHLEKPVKIFNSFVLVVSCVTYRGRRFIHSASYRHIRAHLPKNLRKSPVYAMFKFLRTLKTIRISEVLELSLFFHIGHFFYFGFRNHRGMCTCTRHEGCEHDNNISMNSGSIRNPKTLIVLGKLHSNSYFFKNTFFYITEKFRCTFP